MVNGRGTTILDNIGQGLLLLLLILFNIVLVKVVLVLLVILFKTLGFVSIFSVTMQLQFFTFYVLANWIIGLKWPRLLLLLYGRIIGNS